MAGLLKAHFVNTVKKWKGGAKGVQCEEAVGDRQRGAETERSKLRQVERGGQMASVSISSSKAKESTKECLSGGTSALPPSPC